MDVNLVVLGGRLAAIPEVTLEPGGSTTIECLVTVRSSRLRRRIDVVRVLHHDADAELVESLEETGAELLVVGAIQRRFSGSGNKGRSRLVVVADAIIRCRGRGISGDRPVPSRGP